MDYEFIEWYKLRLDIRADLLTVVEGVRRGANIELWKIGKHESQKLFASQKKLLEFCLNKLGLLFRIHNDDYYVSRSRLWLDKLWKREIKTGEFLGYPKCCIAGFEAGCKAVMEVGNNDKAPAKRYFRELETLINDEDFDMTVLYNQHVPCRLDCRKALKIAQKNRAVLEAHDVEAANYLRDDNLNLVYQFAYKYPKRETR